MPNKGWPRLLPWALTGVLLTVTVSLYFAIRQVQDSQALQQVLQQQSVLRREVDRFTRIQIQGLKRLALRWENFGDPVGPAWEADIIQFLLHYPAFERIDFADAQFSIRWSFVSQGRSSRKVGESIAFDDNRRAALLAAARQGIADAAPAFQAKNGWKLAFFQPRTAGDDLVGFVGGEMDVIRAVELVSQSSLASGFRVQVGNPQLGTLYDSDSNMGLLGAFAQSFVVDLDRDEEHLGWTFSIEPTPALRESEGYTLPQAVLFLGSVISLLFGFLARLVQKMSLQSVATRSANQALRRQVQERELVQHELQKMVKHDVLTGLPNRSFLLEYLSEHVKHAKKTDSRLAVFFLDLDGFKDINDTMGHATGDYLLVQIPQRLRSVLDEGAFVARLGGDEFVVVIRDIDGESGAAQIARNIAVAMRSRFELSRSEVYVSFSIGIAIFPQAGATPEELIRNADAALYGAKDQGRDTFNFFTDILRERAIRRLELSKHLRLAIENELFNLYYQPIVDLDSGLITGVEALLRWDDPTFGKVEPDEFIPVAEEMGLILSLGRWVIERACRDAVTLMKIAGRRLTMAVNISPVQLRQAGFVDDLSQILEQSGLDASILEVELTERIMIDNQKQNIAVMNELRAMGLGVSIDDFGTGYSAMAYLQQFPVGCLKIDQAFVRDLTRSRHSEAIMRAILALAQSLGLRVIAEGVETVAQAEMLKQHGCDMAQGYLYGRAMRLEEICDLVIARTV